MWHIGTIHDPRAAHLDLVSPTRYGVGMRLRLSTLSLCHRNSSHLIEKFSTSPTSPLLQYTPTLPLPLNFRPTLSPRVYVYKPGGSGGCLRNPGVRGVAFGTPGEISCGYEPPKIVSGQATLPRFIYRMHETNAQKLCARCISLISWLLKMGFHLQGRCIIVSNANCYCSL